MARARARRGAIVVGVDISSVLLDQARATQEADRLGISYMRADATAPGTLVGERLTGWSAAMSSIASM